MYAQPNQEDQDELNFDTTTQSNYEHSFIPQDEFPLHSHQQQGLNSRLTSSNYNSLSQQQQQQYQLQQQQQYYSNNLASSKKLGPNKNHDEIELKQQTQYSAYPQIDPSQNYEEYEVKQQDFSQFDALPIITKITHSKWQVRKLGYQQLTQILEEEYEQSQQQQQEDQQQSQTVKGLNIYLNMSQLGQESEIGPETLAPWMKNIVDDSNVLAFQEGVKCLLAFVKHFQSILNNSFMGYFLPDLLEKAIQLKTYYNKIVLEIVMICVESQENGFVFSEIFKKFDHKNPKICLFAITLINSIITRKSRSPIEDENLRLIFRKNIGILQHPQAEIRQMVIKNMVAIFKESKDTYDEVKKAFFTSKEIKPNQLKELEKEFKKCRKNSGKNSFTLINKQVQKALEGTKINNQIIDIGTSVDLSSILPDKFFEIPYLKNPRDKKEKLEKLAKDLETTFDKGAELLPNKDYSNIYNILSNSIEESNHLVYSEAIKCFVALVKLLKAYIPYPILKHFTFAIGEKYKAPKQKGYNQNIDNVFEQVIRNRCMSDDSFLDLILNMCDNEKNLHMRIGVTNWLGTHYSQYLKVNLNSFKTQSKKFLYC